MVAAALLLLITDVIPLPWLAGGEAMVLSRLKIVSHAIQFHSDLSGLVRGNSMLIISNVREVLDRVWYHVYFFALDAFAVNAACPSVDVCSPQFVTLLQCTPLPVPPLMVVSSSSPLYRALYAVLLYFPSDIVVGMMYGDSAMQSLLKSAVTMLLLGKALAVCLTVVLAEDGSDVKVNVTLTLLLAAGLAFTTWLSIQLLAWIGNPTFGEHLGRKLGMTVAGISDD